MSDLHTAAIVGCGQMAGPIDDYARRYAGMIFPYGHAGTYQTCSRTQLVAVAEIVDDRLQSFCERWKVPRGYHDYREMIERERPEILSVTTRPRSHREIVEFAAEHGVRGIWCEKPLGCSLADADAMVDVCEKHGVKFNFGANRRYNPRYRAVREMIADGAVGTVQSVICHAGGAALWTHSHAADLLLMLAGDPEVEFIQGTVGVDVADFTDNRLECDPEIHSAFVQFRNGIRGYFLSTIGYDWEVTGSTGKLRTLNDGQLVELRRLGDTWKQLDAVDAPLPPDGSSALALLEDLVDAIETGRETIGYVELARRSHELIFGIIASHGENGARVTLPLTNRTFYVGERDW